MDKYSFEERKAFAGEKIPSMQRRCCTTDDARPPSWYTLCDKEDGKAAWKNPA